MWRYPLYNLENFVNDAESYIMSYDNMEYDERGKRWAFLLLKGLRTFKTPVENWSQEEIHTMKDILCGTKETRKKWKDIPPTLVETMIIVSFVSDILRMAIKKNEGFRIMTQIVEHNKPVTPWSIFHEKYGKLVRDLSWPSTSRRD